MRENNKDTAVEKGISGVYNQIKAVLVEARSKAYRSVNIAMVQTYWNIGRLIVEEEQQGEERAVYGTRLIEELSTRLSIEFGKGFDSRNLWFMRSFFLAYPKVNALRSELSWTHYRLLLKVEREDIRKFYMEECIVGNWSTRQLERQINSFYYERLLASRDRKPVREEIAQLETGPTPEDLIKDPYVLEFLQLGDAPCFREKDLESALIDKLQDFLLELGKGFSFVARQKRFTLDGRHFYIDLVFYNYILKCFVLIDLKVGTLMHQDLGQMQMYVNYYTREMMNEGDNPPVGIILCSDKSDAVVRYTLPEDNKQIFASRYKLYLPSEEELTAELLRERSMFEMETKLSQEDVRE
ncbi:MAG: PDDEXK nuclease domain-containing protein [Proteobacteria bacterium]|nr:PDDEXK nuclease domain-containing protein [Pseudomonadota bacterium]